MMILTAKEMIESTEKLMKDACEEEGVDYQEFLEALDAALTKMGV